MSSTNQDEMEKEILPFVMENVPLSYAEKAKKDLRESPEIILRGLKEIKEMAKAHNTTRDIDFEDDFLLQYLRHRKFNVEKAFKQLLNFTEFRIANSDWFDCSEKNLFSSSSKQYICMLPKRTPDGCAIYYIDIAKWNTDHIPVKVLQREMMMVFCQAHRYPMTQINGIKIIVDFANTTIKHLRHATPVNLYCLYHVAMMCLPGRYKEIHFVNKGLTMRVALAVGKPFLTPKIRSRLFLHESPEDLLDFFPASVLPVKYGGTLKEYRKTEWLNRAYERQNNFPLCRQPNIEGY